MAANPPRLRVGGEKLSRASGRGTRHGIWIVGGVFILLITQASLFLDFGLGPIFMNDQATAEGLKLIQLSDGATFENIVGFAILAGISLSTTGILYALFHKTRGQRFHPVRLVAWVVSFADTLYDIGGLNSLLHGDPSIGQRILLPEDAPGFYWVIDAIVFALCFFHEWALGKLLRRYQGSVNRSGKSKGEKLEASLVWLAGASLSLARFIAIPAGAFSLWVLDFILTPQMRIDSPLPWWVFVLLSLLVGGWPLMAWRFFIHIGPDGFRGLPRSEKILVIVTWTVGVVDTIFDMQGFNNTLYGTTDLFISNPTPASWLTFFIISILCFMNEPINTEIIAQLDDDDEGGDDVVEEIYIIEDSPHR